MQKIESYIFNLSPKKLAIYLVLYPLILFLIYTIVGVTIRAISQEDSTSKAIVSIIVGVLFMLLGVLVLLWIFWLRSTVYAVQEAELGLARKWFKGAYALLWLFIVYNLVKPLIKTFLENSGQDKYLHLISAFQEFINFGGIIIAYPIICHYTARATMVKRSNKQGTFLNAIPFTLLLIFGTVLGVPFLHKYFSNKETKNSEIVKFYAIGFVFFMVSLIIGFIAAITGVV
jgi:hypothetical protein